MFFQFSLEMKNFGKKGFGYQWRKSNKNTQHNGQPIRKGTKTPTIVDKPIHRKPKNEQHEPHYHLNR
jgi:hypothetical protein